MKYGEQFLSVFLCSVLFLTGCVVDTVNSVPLRHARSRPMAIRFGMHVTPDPAGNPINPPENFTGYHVGLDYEILGDELDTEVPVFAICNGAVLYSGYAAGYGGVLVQRCNIRNQDVTVIYGHLSSSGLMAESIVAETGQQIAVLADSRSYWSGGNRKHLHLGIHKGEAMDMRGYAGTASELSDFIDPLTILPPESRGRLIEKFSVPKAGNVLTASGNTL